MHNGYKVKHRVISEVKEVKDLYIKTTKLMKEVKDTQNGKHSVLMDLKN